MDSTFWLVVASAAASSLSLAGLTGWLFSVDRTVRRHEAENRDVFNHIAQALVRNQKSIAQLYSRCEKIERKIWPEIYSPLESIEVEVE